MVYLVSNLVIYGLIAAGVGFGINAVRKDKWQAQSILIAAFVIGLVLGVLGMAAAAGQATY